MGSKKANIGRRTRNSKSVYNRRLKLKKKIDPVLNHPDNESEKRYTPKAKSVNNRRLKLKKKVASVPNPGDDKSEGNRTDELEANSSQARYAPAPEESTKKENQSNRGSNEFLNFIRWAFREILSRSKGEHKWNHKQDTGEKWKKTDSAEGDANQATASITKVMPRVLDPLSIKSEPVYLAMVDTCEQFIDEGGVHDRKEYIIENGENESNPPVMAMDAHHSPASFNKKTFRVLDPPVVHLDQREFAKRHLVGTSDEKYLDKPVQDDHTYCRKYDEKLHVKSEIVDILEQLTDKEEEKFGIRIEVGPNQPYSSFTEGMPEVRPTTIKYESIHLDQFSKCHIQYDHTASPEDDKKWHVESGILDTPGQFIDNEGNHDKEKFVIKNEENNSNSSVMEVDADQTLAPCNEEMLHPTRIKSEPAHWGQCEFPVRHSAGVKNGETNPNTLDPSSAKELPRVSPLNIDNQKCRNSQDFHSSITRVCRRN
ncbi:uncharacterized protein LOC123307496 isoform X2 [Coccinella septempunctata]|uniref:uncharacterized protein LOC123307496 isoform X2 n=1 Tax=Coccinella septempunctata TaxID=41139 RepID=UPI001D080DF7|nr:uncharacterized protein LOC123307496 isoform X2 [Coccinella septempunctata]